MPNRRHPEPAPDRRRPGGDELELYTSLRGLAGAVVTPAGLVLVGVLGSARFGVNLVTFVLTIAGLAVAVTLLFDFPHRTTFDRSGFVRRCALRRQRVTWDEVASLDRTPPKAASVLRNLGARSRDDAEPEVSGALVARGSGRRRWLLTDRVESREEHDGLVDLIATSDADVEVYAERPHERAVSPSRYRRR
jgi:hypothetical protein